MGPNAYGMLLGYTDMIYYQRDDKKLGEIINAIK